MACISVAWDRSLAMAPAGAFGEDARAGYALTDALVAMLILAMTLVMSLRALGQARDVADRAWEVRRAETLIAYLIEAAPHRYEASAGARDGFGWRVETTTTGAERPVEICHRTVALENRHSGRRYRAATLEACPVEPLA
jgi:hypothetical protein